MGITSDEFLKRVQELFSLYDRVKKITIWSEEFDPKREFYLAPMNELRSCLDHFFKASLPSHDMNYELIEASEHLDRAGYDSFEIFAANLSSSIAEKLKDYSPDILSRVFPDYYTEIKPKITEIQGTIAEIRKRKRNSTNGENIAFEAYFDQVYILTKFNERVDCMIPGLEEYKGKKEEEERLQKIADRKARNKERIFNLFVVGIVAATISGLGVYYITSRSFRNEKSTTKIQDTVSVVSSQP